jgi:uncharacterized sodium:solute symporter family permease YidK
MLLRTRHATDRERPAARDDLRPDLSLQVVLWLCWVLAVVGTAYLVWQGNVAASQPVDLVRLVLRSAIVGVVGLIVMTKVEMAAEPWRFLG